MRMNIARAKGIERCPSSCAIFTFSWPPIFERRPNASRYDEIGLCWDHQSRARIRLRVEKPEPSIFTGFRLQGRQLLGSAGVPSKARASGQKNKARVVSSRDTLPEALPKSKGCADRSGA